jgi:hypothetical protein
MYSHRLALLLPMSLTLYQAAGVVAAVWLLWKTLKQWVFKSPLDNIPGPPAESFWTGAASLSSISLCVVTKCIQRGFRKNL